MGQSEELIEALKIELKKRRITYAEIARALDLSEASIKRVFASQTFSLKRFEAVCDHVGVTLYELAEIARQLPAPITQLSPDQEVELVKDTALLLFAVLVLNDWSFDEILQRFDFTEHQAVRYLAQLDRLKMIELLPDNRVRKLVARNFSWRSNGPVRRFFEQHVRDEFFESRFDLPGEHLRLASGTLSSASIQRLKTKIDAWVKEMDQAVEGDLDLPAEDRVGTSLVLALRPWEPSVFRQYRRP